MTRESRLSKLEASILPEVRPPKVVVIEGYRDGEDMDVARDRHFAAHPRTGVRPSWFSFERCSGARTRMVDPRGRDGSEDTCFVRAIAWRCDAPASSA
jgi:hypothetical protein